MAYYKVGDRILSSEEWDDEVFFKWQIALFIIGAVVVGWGITSTVPDEWPKYIRFPLAVVSALLGGYSLTKFAKQIAELIAWLILIAIVGGIGLVIWNVMD